MKDKIENNSGDENNSYDTNNIGGGTGAVGIVTFILGLGSIANAFSIRAFGPRRGEDPQQYMDSGIAMAFMGGIMACAGGVMVSISTSIKLISNQIKRCKNRPIVDASPIPSQLATCINTSNISAKSVHNTCFTSSKHNHKNKKPKKKVSFS